MSEPVDQEIEAIRAVLAAMKPLSDKARISVLDYVVKRLDIDAGEALATGSSDQARGTPVPKDEDVDVAEVHIKSLKGQKKPRSANEMAALVAYYLSNVAPANKRKTTVNRKDIESYFKIAEFRLPSQPQVTLTNAKNAGYFDAAGGGEFKLNPVGHNLVVHSMPRGSAKATANKKARPKKSKSTKK